MLKSRLLLFVSVLSMFLAGCGGGGGGGDVPGPGGGASGNLTYATDWSGRGRSGPNGQSQRITVLRADGTIFDSKILNASEGRQEYRFASLPSGTFTVEAQLNSEPDLQGQTTGVVRTVVTGGSATTVETAVGLEPTAISVTPANLEMVVGKTQAFSASFKAADGRFTFASPDAFTWSAGGTNVSVIPGGIATAEAVGTGFVRATANGLTGSAPVTVKDTNTQKGTWTVLVFLNAANDLYPYSTPDVNEMERVANNPNVRFVVQWKQSRQVFPNSTFDGTRRYVVKPDNTSSIASEMVQDMGTGVDMGAPDTLRQFVDWGKSRYPADHYALVVWNHGNGWTRSRGSEATRGISYDDQFNSVIDTWQLSQALGNHRFDILAFDACSMQMLEVAYEVKDHADYIAASAELTPAEGYPYHSVFNLFAANPTGNIRDLTKAFSDGMINEPKYANLRLTQSVLDTSKLQGLSVAVDNLAAALIAHKGEVGPLMGQIRSNAQRYDLTNANHHYYDLFDVANRLSTGVGVPPAVSTAAASVKTAVKQAVVWESHSSRVPNANGISIDFSSATQISNKIDVYGRLRLSGMTRWDDWLSVAP